MVYEILDAIFSEILALNIMFIDARSTEHSVDNHLDTSELIMRLWS